MACWRKIDKEKFALHVITEYEQTVKSEISHTAIFAKNDLKSMQDEVDAELAELSASSSDDDIDEDLQPVHKKRKE
jgi:hypothetical protein